MRNIVIADRETEKMMIDRLLKDYATITLPKGYSMQLDELAHHSREADAIITVFSRIPREVIEGAKRLKIIAVAAAGFDCVDVATATKLGIPVVRAATATVEGVAEHAIALMMAVSRRLLAAVENVRRGNWDFRNTRHAFSNQIAGKVAGVIGLGKVGSSLAKKLSALDMRVMVYDPYVPESRVRQLNAEPVSLERLLRESDYVFIASSLTKETWHMIADDELRMMKRGSFLINVARGGIVDEGALYRALKGGWLAGAALDVLEEEPPSQQNPLLHLENCLVTPHIAGQTFERYLEVGRVVVDEVKRVLEGGLPTLDNLVNHEVLGSVPK